MAPGNLHGNHLYDMMFINKADGRFTCYLALYADGLLAISSTEAGPEVLLQQLRGRNEDITAAQAAQLYVDRS